METVTQEGLKEIFKNVLKATIVIFYFFVIYIINCKVNEHQIIRVLQVSTMVVLFIGLWFIERSYRKDSGKTAIEGIEILVIATVILSIIHVVKKLNIDFKHYVLISSYIIAGYFILRAIIEYIRQCIITKPSYSDVSEIVKEEPKKREAFKRSEENNTKKNDEVTNQKVEKTKKSSTKKASKNNSKKSEKDIVKKSKSKKEGF